MDRSALLKEFGFEKEEVRESSTKMDWLPTGYPDPIKSYELVWEVYDLSLEEPYFWVVDNMREYLHYVEKIEDSFTAAENSAFFGVSQQRLGAQQDKVSQFLATTGKMIKELFQMVRELRIIDERLDYYQESKRQLSKPIKQRSRSAEITLKGMFVDLVQGGGKSAASVYGMARELEFITLPDLFFDAPPFANIPELDNHINSLEKDFNKNVLRVLQRHLRQYMEWAKRTRQEHINRRRFMLQYLLQHFEIIKMYIAWIKPYLRHVEELSLKQKDQMSPDIITAFEGSLLDIEIIARREYPAGDTTVHGCVLCTFNFRTRPELKVVQEGYQRGPVHIGKLRMNYRVYTWTDKELENFRKMKDKETLLLMGDVSSSVQQAMEALGKELDVYLDEARGKKAAKDMAKQYEDKPKNSLTKRMFGDFYNSKKTKAKVPKKKSRKQLYAQQLAISDAKASAKRYMFAVAFNGYKNFKKAHRMVSW